MDHSKLSSVSSISRHKLNGYLQLLEQTYLIYQISPFTKNIDKEISKQKKLYFSDNGVLQALADNQLSSGQIFGKTAVEVKETAMEQDRNSLRSRAASIQFNHFHLIGRTPAGNGFNDFIRGGSIY